MNKMTYTTLPIKWTLLTLTPLLILSRLMLLISHRPGLKEKVGMPQDKWFAIDQKTKEQWDQIDDSKYK
jgi:hypothetical protein